MGIAISYALLTYFLGFNNASVNSFSNKMELEIYPMRLFLIILCQQFITSYKLTT